MRISSLKISGNKSFSGNLQIDYLIENGDLVLLNSDEDNFWGEMSGEDVIDDDVPALFSIFSKDGLLIFPKKNEFKIFVFNSTFSLAMDSIDEFNEEKAEILFSILENGKFNCLDLKHELLTLFSSKKFLQHLKLDRIVKITEVMLRKILSAVFEVLSDEKIGPIPLFCDLFGISTMYRLILKSCSSTLFESSSRRSVVNFLLYLIKLNLHRVDEFSSILESLSSSIVSMDIKSKESMFSVFDLIILHSSNEDLKSKIIEHLISNMTSAKTKSTF
jgi:hypothetical protein